MFSRRDFLKKSGALGISFMAPGVAQPQLYDEGLDLVKRIVKAEKDIDSLVNDERFWLKVRTMFSPPTTFINLENGYFSPQPLATLHRQQGYLSDLNTRSSFLMRREQSELINDSKKALARFSGVNQSEFVICRNTTEALDTVIHGFPWKKKDEVVLCDQDYYSVRAAFEQEVRRSKIKTVYVNLPLHPKNDDEIINIYEQAITRKTRVILLTHMINITGQILPVKKITEMAHSKGVEVILDAAHSFAHIPFNIHELNVDYMGTSLHKWLCSPIGLGMLYMKKEHINKIWPLFGDDEFAREDIRKLEHLGTRPVSTIATLKHSIDFHNAIGSTLKWKRLTFLKTYWLSKARLFNGFVSNTPTEPNRSCAIANFAIKGKEPNQIVEHLLKKFKVFTVAINESNVKGVRVTPHLYNTTTELDQLLLGINNLCA